MVISGVKVKMPAGAAGGVSRAGLGAARRVGSHVQPALTAPIAHAQGLGEARNGGAGVVQCRR